MEYFGAEEYYFYEGLKEGIFNALKLDLTNLEEYTSEMFHMVNETSIKCSNAFIWGVLLGKNLNKEEYKDLFKQKEEISTKLEKSVECPADYKYNKANTNVKGNC